MNKTLYRAELKGLDRLEVLSEFLTTVPRKQFSMQVWKREDACGTAACAAGWAASIPSFRRAGFGLERNSYSVYSVPVFQGRASMEAVRAFFSLTRSAAEYLFGHYDTRTPKQEAKVLRVYVAQRRKEIKQEMEWYRTHDLELASGKEAP